MINYIEINDCLSELNLAEARFTVLRDSKSYYDCLSEPNLAEARFMALRDSEIILRPIVVLRDSVVILSSANYCLSELGCGTNISTALTEHLIVLSPKMLHKNNVSRDEKWAKGDPSSDHGIHTCWAGAIYLYAT